MQISTQQIGECKVVITEKDNKNTNFISISLKMLSSTDTHEIDIKNPVLVKAIKSYLKSGDFEYFLLILKECHSNQADKIASILSKEFNNVLKTIANTVYNKTKKLIPVAANKPSLKDWPSHRKLIMFLSRSRKLGINEKERINKLKLFLLENREIPGFLAMRIQGKYFGIDNPYLSQILDIVTHLPDIDDKVFHKLQPKNPFILVSFDENKVIAKENLSKISDKYSYFFPPIIIKQGKKNMSKPEFIEKEALSFFELEYFSYKKLNPGVIEVNCKTDGLQ